MKKIFRQSPEERKRQRELAAWIGKNCMDTSMVVVPFGSHGTYCPGRPPLRLHRYLDRLCDTIWTPVAWMLEDAMDHAWMFGPEEKGDPEPWGFATEPYKSRDAAQRLAKAVDEALRDLDLGVRVIVPPPEIRSSWAPGCVPIVACLDVHGIGRFTRWAVHKLFP